MSSLKSSRTLSIVVPCYNSENTLTVLVPELIAVASSVSSSFEVILVNDGSRDGTWQVIEDLVSRFRQVRGIDLTKNFGQHNATLCGILQAQNEIIVTIDDDSQNPPGEIPRLIEKIEQGYEVVYGVPVNKQHGLIRKLGSFALRFILKVVGAKSSRGISSFRVLRSSLARSLEDYYGNVVCIDVLFSWTTENFATVAVTHRPRTRDVSSYTFLKLAKFAFDIILAYSSLPLKLIGLAGAFFVLCSFVLLFCSVIFLSLGASTMSLALFMILSSVLLLGGLNLFGLGIVGEYLVRMHASAVRQPSFKIAQEVSQDSIPHRSAKIRQVESNQGELVEVR
ncbi:MAG: glycosyltransferase family 2 protein [Cyanobacteriota/Melainabacteria group bacterium]